jgi:protein tyrosine/serine phosphatase
MSRPLSAAANWTPFRVFQFFAQTSRKAGTLLFGGVVLLSSCGTSPRGVPATAGVANYAEVSKQLSRGAQPDEPALEELAKGGVRTIVNLRMRPDAWAGEEAFVRARGMRFVHVPLSGWRAPTSEDIELVLATIRDHPAPVFVHCEHGADRTGLVVACYRIREQGWSIEQALAEARKHGMSPFQIGMKNFIRAFGEKEAKRRPRRQSHRPRARTLCREDLPPNMSGRNLGHELVYLVTLIRRICWCDGRSRENRDHWNRSEPRNRHPHQLRACFHVGCRRS